MNIETVLKKAYVYRSGCMVTRYGKVHLVPGENRAVIAGMSSTAFIDTMQLKMDPTVKASAVHIIKKDEDEQEAGAIADSINETKEMIAVLREQAEMWKAGAEFARSANASLSDVETYIAAYPQRVKEIRAEIRELEKELKRLNKELNKASGRDNRPLISVILNAQEEKDYPFELIYQETAAYWNTLYEVHADTAAGTLDVKMKAEIRQNTDEDWKDVKLALRTGVPVRSASLPFLNPVYLDFRTQYHNSTADMMPRPMMASRKMSLNSAEPMRESAEMEDAWGDTAALGRVQMEDAQVSSGDTMTEYTPTALYDIAAGGDGLNIDLQSFTMKADYVTKAVPKKDIRAYLLAEISTSDLPASIRGNAAVYLDGVYTGTANLSPDFTKDKYAIALGMQEAISLTRKENKKKSSEAFLRNSQSTVYECEIKVSNAKDTPVSITVTDQIPVAREAAITVEVISDDHAVRDAKTGRLEWKLELKPQETRILRTEYRVNWPKDKNLNQSSF